MVYPAVVILSYLLGSIPTGFLVARARGVDIRTAGSGNIGTTNVFRVLGRPAGSIVMLVDVLKGVLGSAVVPLAVLAVAGAGAAHRETLEVIGGSAAVLGHNYTCWLNFKGGKGVATTGGVLLGLVPLAFGVALLVWLVTLVVTRFVSLASIAAAVSLPIAVSLAGGSKVLTIIAAALGMLAIGKHRSNLQRLLNGTEPRVGRRGTVKP